MIRSSNTSEENNLSEGAFLRPETGYAGLSQYVERRFHYDTLGRRIASEDPDTDSRGAATLAHKTWRYLYNPVGDLAAVRDPRGCGQNFYYDLAGRLLGEAHVGCAEAQVGELPSADVPAGSVGLTLTTAATNVHLRYHFDAYPDWASGLVPSGGAGVLGRATGITDRAQRSVAVFDPRGNVVQSIKQLAVIAPETSVAGDLGIAAAPAPSVETGPAPGSVIFYLRRCSSLRAPPSTTTVGALSHRTARTRATAADRVAARSTLLKSPQIASPQDPHSSNPRRSRRSGISTRSTRISARSSRPARDLRALIASLSRLHAINPARSRSRTENSSSTAICRARDPRGEI